MAIGRSFPEALQKALRSMESPDAPFSWADPPGDKSDLLRRVRIPHDGRLATIHQALRAGMSVAAIVAASGIDPWFIEQIAYIENIAQKVRGGQGIDAATLTLAKGAGFSDRQIGQLRGMTEDGVREIRWGLDLRPVYHAVDTCAAEFAARSE
jgi:carbamoyl-phosphate synthase large subunit